MVGVVVRKAVEKINVIKVILFFQNEETLHTKMTYLLSWVMEQLLSRELVLEQLLSRELVS